jgi:hypothetical protein
MNQPDHYAAWAWLLVGCWTLLGWIPVDIWLHANGHPWLTTQMRNWMHDQNVGPFIFAFLAFIVVLFMVHMLIAGPHQ